MPYKITKDVLRNAVTYMPLRTKIELSKDIANLCLENLDTDEQNKVGESLIALPHLKGENLALKNILLLNTLLGFYLDVDLPQKDAEGNEIDPYDLFDYYAGDHLLNQIERFKADPEVKDIVFDLLSDYKDLKKIVDTEIYNQKSNVNDTIPRLSAAIAVLGSPDTMKKVIEELKKLGEEHSAKLEEQKIAMAKAFEERVNAES